ncbi:hypothetical protein [Sporosarcina aquimarina]|uniref:Uncharacterized protein n=1 Tax=Sporosarcina aquimarina TaxID=114975 RepID=A0ABU4FV36_9BACL|nr:hypothetical protein [Sporosarcina aquimarina]MDW0108569.1 hypothetical protein [Sporosarcina aquimarina]
MVTISMNPAVTETNRYASLKKRSAEAAYTKNAEYAGGNEQKRNEAEQQLTASSELMRARKADDFQKLGAGQLKQITLPLGKTLEETISSWQEIRRDALTGFDPAEMDLQLAAAASAKIMETEGQLALEERMRSLESQEESAGESNSPNVVNDLFLTETMQKRYNHAATAYAIQVNAKQQGYEVASPAYSLIA